MQGWIDQKGRGLALCRDAAASFVWHVDLWLQLQPYPWGASSPETASTDSSSIGDADASRATHTPHPTHHQFIHPFSITYTGQGMAQPPPQRPPGIAPADWAALPLDIQQELSTPAAAAAAPTPAVISLLDDDDDGGGGKDEAQQLQRALQASAAEHAAAAAVAAGGGKAKTAAADEDEDEDEMIEVTVLPPKPAAAASARKRPRPTEEEQDGGGGGAAAISGKGKAKKKGGGASWVALRRGAEEGWVASRTQDSEWEEGLAEWRRLAQFQEGRTGAIYRDTEFCGMKRLVGCYWVVVVRAPARVECIIIECPNPVCPLPHSITGRESGGGGKKKGGGGGEEGARPDCRCGTKAKLCKVRSLFDGGGVCTWPS